MSSIKEPNSCLITEYVLTIALQLAFLNLTIFYKGKNILCRLLWIIICRFKSDHSSITIDCWQNLLISNFIFFNQRLTFIVFHKKGTLICCNIQSVKFDIHVLGALVCGWEVSKYEMSFIIAQRSRLNLILQVIWFHTSIIKW